MTDATISFSSLSLLLFPKATSKRKRRAGISTISKASLVEKGQRKTEKKNTREGNKRQKTHCVANKENEL